MRWWAQRARRLADENGAAAVEFALILLPLILVIIGVIDFGRALYTRNNMIQAADHGARVLLLKTAPTEEQLLEKTVQEVKNAFIAGPSDALAVTLGTANDSGIEFRTISLTYEFDLITPLLVVDRITMEHTRRVPVD